ncbi:hypothetical protein ACEPAG_4837 [Sanghuangporus baumii]
MRSWKISASESIFSVQLPDLDPLDPTSNGRNSKSSQQRNRKPCGRCSDKQKRCDISPPYSSTRCRACAKANLPFCPPYKARRLSDVKQTIARSAHRFEQDQAPKISSRPSASQSQYSGISTATDFTQRPVIPTEGETSAQDFQVVEMGLDPADVLMSSRHTPLLDNNCVYYDFDQANFNGGLDSGVSLLPLNNFFGQSEDVLNGSDFVFPNTFAPAFLPSL